MGERMREKESYNVEKVETTLRNAKDLVHDLEVYLAGVKFMEGEDETPDKVDPDGFGAYMRNDAHAQEVKQEDSFGTRLGHLMAEVHDAAIKIQKGMTDKQRKRFVESYEGK
ncbi:MAG: hypothetical protein A3C50_01110 [Candidatus Staskawiczbacteria bacterium RIFCSPHIGHO2_02_FULL_43_16]|uniref:Uncharacterized protein n=1 Tax=Candidatus Staskawiczbacteria bacterium RIFCSPHIGHO2_01_FULL_41_41 TaxID=1802203 RepID=A0A1G2HVW1_9BACT|nr:MAG: hypothetical protein A2822_04800 [Candidatus Staskawiczbacteria bacterium RIFCSPHIGHO2_01_FULL_41_41]OGZ68400.1 MAG: hypothetical protein A3C50_01110 [Candidatus Staskawiczbacteria bacterium RIFCSPHIGHO2_02_FULL_43_16]OGZ74182.1 MAG: hypothetical protein A3A12_00105 [Candidatus Staskawiczbacteria bacterium RIFCSPLOWO2_01_FULL_43_17b]